MAKSLSFPWRRDAPCVCVIDDSADEDDIPLTNSINIIVFAKKKFCKIIIFDIYEFDVMKNHKSI